MAKSLTVDTFRRGRAAPCLVGLACALGAPAASAQPQVLTTPVPTLSMNISLKPATKPGDFDLRVSISPLVDETPEVEFQDVDGGEVRQVVLTKDGDDWTATVSAVPTVSVGRVYVAALAAGDVPEMQTLRFATRGLIKDRAGVVYSPDGQFGLLLPQAQVPTELRFLVTTTDTLPLALPAGVERVAGPFTLTALPTDVADLNASIVVNLPSTSGTPPTYTLRWLDVAGGAWVPLDGGPPPNDKVAQAKITHPGTFVLTKDVP